MKTPFLRHLSVATALILTTAVQSSFAQTTATTDPVGFITLPITGGGSVTAPKFSLISATVTQPISWQGAITGLTTAGAGVNATTTITVSGTPFTVSQYGVSYYAEIVTVSPNTHTTGALASITSTPTTSSIVVSGNLVSPNAFAQVGDTLRIRKEMTLSDVFGTTNTAGFLSTDDPSTSDEVFIYEGGVGVSYFYYIGDIIGNPAGWYRSDTFAPAATTVIGAHQGVVVKRKAAAALNVTANGAVKTGNTLFPVVSGLNVLGTVSAQGLTLATCGLYTGSATTGVKASDDPSTGDNITIYIAGAQKNYFYYVGDTFGNPAGWYQSDTFTLANTVALPPGVSFVLNRVGGGVAFNWSLPSPASF